MLEIDKSNSEWVLAPSTIDKAANSDFAFAGDFTVEIFGFVFADTDEADFLSNYITTGDQRSWLFGYSGTAVQFVGSTDGTFGAAVVISDTWTPTLGVAYDIAVDRSGSTVRLYVDGSMVASETLSGALHQSTAPVLGIGQRSSLDHITTGKAKAVRITDGTARYADDGGYTVPSLPLPPS